jgi:hypothetical protein
LAISSTVSEPEIYLPSMFFFKFKNLIVSRITAYLIFVSLPPHPTPGAGDPT